MASYPACDLRALRHPVQQLEGPIAELLRVAHRLGVPLVVWTGSWSGPAAMDGAPGRLLAYSHVCGACDPELSKFIKAIEVDVRDGLLHIGAVPFNPNPEN